MYALCCRGDDAFKTWFLNFLGEFDGPLHTVVYEILYGGKTYREVSSVLSKWNAQFDKSSMSFLFETEKDAMMFLLRWT